MQKADINSRQVNGETTHVYETAIASRVSTINDICKPIVLPVRIRANSRLLKTGNRTDCVHRLSVWSNLERAFLWEMAGWMCVRGSFNETRNRSLRNKNLWNESYLWDILLIKRYRVLFWQKCARAKRYAPANLCHHSDTFNKPRLPMIKRKCSI